MNLVDELWWLTEHPAAEGMAAMVALLVALVAPVVGGWLAAQWYLTTVGAGDAWLVAYLWGVGGALTGIALFNRVLHQTVVFEWFASFMQWASILDSVPYEPEGGRE